MSYEELKSKINTSLELEIYKYAEEQNRKERTKKKFWDTQIAPIILSAIFALIGTGIGALIQGRANSQLEKEKFQASLILRMLETNDQKKAASNLNFLIKAGLIQNYLLQEKLAKIITDSSAIPTLGLIGNSESEQSLNIPQITESDEEITKRATKSAILRFDVKFNRAITTTENINPKLYSDKDGFLNVKAQIEVINKNEIIITFDVTTYALKPGKYSAAVFYSNDKINQEILIGRSYEIILD